jgi:predicted transcriptional regulator
MTIERVSQPDIARTLHLTQPRISQLLLEAFEERQPARAQTIERAREMALMECDLHAAPWMKRARTSPRAAEVLLSWLTRSDRIQGLYQSHTSLSLDSTRSPEDPAPDWSRLDDAELAQYERLHMKLHGIAPAPEPTYETVIMPEHRTPTAQAPAQIEDHSIVAVQRADEPLRDKILRLYQGGMSASDIAQSLALSRSALIEAIEDHGQQDTIQ